MHGIVAETEINPETQSCLKGHEMTGEGDDRMKILVAHPAQQHSYRLAAALKKAGILCQYATTVYYKKGSFTALAAKGLKGQFRTKAESRRSPELSDREVVQFCEIGGLLKLLALNTKYLKKQYRAIKYNTADRFAIKAAKYAVRNRMDAVITYDDTSPLLFEMLEKKAPDVVRIIDMSAANILYMRSIYERDIALSPAFAERLRNERKICWDPFTLKRIRRELKAAQFFLVPSEFVGRSLEYSGIKKDKIYHCPYGVDTEEFSAKKYEDILPGSRPLEFIYVGGVKELKGISYLLDAFSRIPADEGFLTVVGKYDPEDADTAPYAKTVNFTGTVLHSEVPALLHKADVFILPSLGEGMALSAIEAASCGLPLILSENSGLKEMIIEGVNGFTVPIQSAEALVEKIRFFIEQPDRIRPMGENARKMAEQYTWERYSRNAAEAVIQMIERHQRQ